MSHLRAVIYARFSTDKQNARSIDDQIKRCREFAKRYGFEVIEVYDDHARSGKSDQRERLQALRKSAAARAFDVVIVDDISRLSRDLGTMWTIVFGEFPAYGVTLWDVLTGIPSTSPAAKMVFGSMGLGSEQLIDTTKHKVHGALVSLAEGGFSIGGVVYGYSSVYESGEPDGRKHPRRVRVINQAEAKVVQLIFDLFVNHGLGYKAIAHTLNARKIAAPQDGAKRRHKSGTGWGPTSVRSILRNTRYGGRWPWNRTQSVRVPGQQWRRRLERPTSEHVTIEMPHLRIVDARIFTAAERRIERHSGPRDASGKHPRKGRPVATGRNAYLVTGLLRCACGHSMTVVGAWKKGGERRVAFGCAAAYNRGTSVCSNRLTIAEETLTAALLDEIRSSLTDPAFVEAVSKGVERRMRSVKSDPPDVSAKLQEAERKLRNVIDEIENYGGSPALRERRAEWEAKRDELRKTQETTPPVLRVPSPTVIRSRVKDLLSDLSSGSDVRGRREMLSRCLTPLRMTPCADGRYRAEGHFSLAGILAGASSAKSQAG